MALCWDLDVAWSLWTSKSSSTTSRLITRVSTWRVNRNILKSKCLKTNVILVTGRTSSWRAVSVGLDQTAMRLTIWSDVVLLALSKSKFSACRCMSTKQRRCLAETCEMIWRTRGLYMRVGSTQIIIKATRILAYQSHCTIAYGRCVWLFFCCLK
jgi:hypothetical protein